MGRLCEKPQALLEKRQTARPLRFESVESIIANYEKVDSSDDEYGHRPSARSRTGLLSPSLNPNLSSTIPIYAKETIPHNIKPLSSSLLEASSLVTQTVLSEVASTPASLRTTQPRRSRIATRSWTKPRTPFFALDTKGSSHTVGALY